MLKEADITCYINSWEEAIKNKIGLLLFYRVSPIFLDFVEIGTPFRIEIHVTATNIVITTLL